MNLAEQLESISGKVGKASGELGYMLVKRKLTKVRLAEALRLLKEAVVEIERIQNAKS